MGLCLAKQLMSTQKIIIISKVQYFDFLVSCLYTFNPLSLKWVMTLVKQHTERNVEKEKSCKISNIIRVKGSERRPFIFISRLNIVQRDSYQMKLSWKLRDGNKKLRTIMSKALVEFY